MKILNTLGKEYPSDALQILQTLGEVDFKDYSQNELGLIIGDYDAAVIGLGLVFNAEVLKNARRLKFIATATTGLDHVDLVAAAERGIEVLSLRGESEFLNTITGTAELAFGLMINLARFVPSAFDSVENGEWDRDKFRGHNLYGKTLGIVGMGRLGVWMAKYGVAFGMNVIYADPFVASVDDLPCRKVGFDELIRSSDFISIHVHLSPETENMFNSKVFSEMKKTAYLINTARGKIINERDLLAALESGQIAGYGTDVLANELDFKDKKISKDALVDYARRNSNVIITPHIGGMTVESRERTDIFMAEKLKKAVGQKSRV